MRVNLARERVALDPSHEVALGKEPPWQASTRGRKRIDNITRRRTLGQMESNIPAELDGIRAGIQITRACVRATMNAYLIGVSLGRSKAEAQNRSAGCAGAAKPRLE